MDLELDPAQAGFDPARLARVDRHLARYVDDGRLAGWQVVVSRDGRVVHHGTYGLRDREAGRPVEPDTIWRVHSMTKPLTSVAAMMLYEDGRLQLRQPLSDVLPEFAGSRVRTAGGATVPAAGPIRIWHLLSHTSGLGYLPAEGTTLAEACRRWAAPPLLFEPGTEWHYSVSTDVLGRVIEVVSGMPLDRFLAERVTGPLGMLDTGFTVPAAQAGRLAALYGTSGAGRVPVRSDDATPDPRRPVPVLSGGSGLVSTAADYARFTAMLLDRGELGGIRLLGGRTVDFMTRNHLPGNADIPAVSRSVGPEDAYEGVGFGLGFGVMVDPVGNETLASPGEYAWGGLASTTFWVDPVERVSVVFLTQLIPSGTYPFRAELRALVNSSLID